MMKKGSTIKNMLFVLVFSYLLQFLQLDIGFSNIKLYMVLSVFLLVYVLKDGNLSLNFLPHEKIWMFSYLLISVSIIYAENISLAAQLIAGQVVLVVSFYVLRALMKKVSLNTLEEIFLKAGNYFVIISIILYVGGLISYYVLHIVPSQVSYLNDHSIRVYGVYLEGFLPRFAGLCASPNNYAYFGILFLWLFVHKKKMKMALITLLTLILSLSTIIIAIVIIQIIIYLAHRRFKYLFLVIIGFILLIFVGIYLQDNYAFIKDIISVRATRNETGSGRYDLWEYCIGLIIKAPFFGYGANQSRVIIADFRELQSSHNSYIEIFLTIGIFGFITYLAFVVSLFNYSRKISKHYNTPLFTMLTLTLIIGGLSNNMLHLEFVVFYLCYIGAYRLNDKPRYLENTTTVN
jgi:O-antigen ligase